MPQVTRSTSTPVGYVLTTMQTQINQMLARMNAGLPILASDVAALISLYNQFVAHYHTASDLKGVQTFGNVGVYSTAGTYVTSTSTTPTGFSATAALAGVAANGAVTAADINAIVGFINSIRTHNHTINDITG